MSRTRPSAPIFEAMCRDFAKVRGPGDFNQDELGLFHFPGYHQAVNQEVMGGAPGTKPELLPIYMAGVFAGSHWMRNICDDKFPEGTHYLEKDPIFWRGLLDRAANVRVQQTGYNALDYPVLDLGGSPGFCKRFLDFCFENFHELEFDPKGDHKKRLKKGRVTVRGSTCTLLVRLIWDFGVCGIVCPDTYDQVKLIQRWTWQEAKKAQMDDTLEAVGLAQKD